MSVLTDRLLILLVAATGLGGFVWWFSGYVVAEFSGTARILVMALVVAAYLGVLALVYLEFVHIDREAPGEPE